MYVNSVWIQVKDYNVLFIDSPIGAGFSYATNSSAFPTTNAQIADDLLECIRSFYNKLPKFRPVPTYIMSESYGGKMAAEFALIWYKLSYESKNCYTKICFGFRHVLQYKKKFREF